MTRRLAQVIFERVIARKREYCVYRAETVSSSDEGGEQIAVYDRAHPPAAQIRDAYRAHLGHRSCWLMFRRMRRGQAVLLVLQKNDLLAGIGWIQHWRPLRHEFWWLEDNGVALGPFWTSPALRGQGIYGRLLARAADEARRRGWKPLSIWAESSNTPSIRGIEKAGFESLGTHRVHTYMLGLIRRHYVVSEASEHPTISAFGSSA